MLGKRSVHGRPTNMTNSAARAYCACSRCGWGLLGHFSLFCHFSLLSPSLWETARYRLKSCLKGPLNAKQPSTAACGIYLTCDKRAVYHIGCEVTPLCHSTGHYRGSGGGESVLEEPFGIQCVRELSMSKVRVAYKTVALAKSEGVANQPVGHSTKNYK